ncbi:uncharacterized protein LOC128551210 [Mercenaria mercenaria]|uniref:uncharacterized protein LOC128551210 n=1 Tax=Mercenaria mercenaria TaxID=6596 RepID=UPI00234F66F5|nr:uncharacterized protein LOC128551210 [Mercenaria mercenaria]
MASTRILCFLVFVTLAAARTLNLERVAISLTEDSKETDSAVPEILNSLLSSHGSTSDDHEFDLRDCSNGTCKFCSTEIIEACFIASVETSGIKMEITINGTPFFETTITFSGEKTICKEIHVIPAVKEICLIFTKINLEQMSGCVSVSFKTKLAPLKFKIGCFKIPHSENQVTGNDEFRQGNQNEAIGDVHAVGQALKFLRLKKYS